jgi:hypothetical protein
MVSCWIVDGKNKPTSTFSNASQHSAAITMIKWNPVGKRLITGDKVRFLLSISASPAYRVVRRKE